MRAVNSAVGDTRYPVVCMVLVRGDLIGVKHDSEDVEDESEG
jgi:hypothetical protein